MFCYILDCYHSKIQLSEKIALVKKRGLKIGFVPTMGALHQGHASLINLALVENDIVVVSIFVNPTQFDNTEDLYKYPRTLERDKSFLASISTELIVFSPSPEEMYNGKIESETFQFNHLDKVMEGEFRIGHFDGVATIVKKLFEIVLPDRAYFGEKDFQQLAIVKRMVEQKNLSVQVIGVPIYREKDGLAMSSRNVRLTEKQRKEAVLLHRVLEYAKSKFGTESAYSIKEWVEMEFKNNSLLELEYFIISEADTLKPIRHKNKTKKYRAFIAAYAGDVRLIDNIALN